MLTTITTWTVNLIPKMKRSRLRRCALITWREVNLLHRAVVNMELEFKITFTSFDPMELDSE